MGALVSGGEEITTTDLMARKFCVPLLPLLKVMSKLNPGAFSFVPGKAFVPAAQQQAASPPPPPIERPAQTEAPAPAPTISLNIGGARPTPASGPAQTISLSIGGSKPATPTPPPVVAPAAPKGTPSPATNAPATTVKVEASTASKTFTTDRAKTDTNAIAQEVKTAADLAVIEDLYGHGG
jgi:peptide chain release factor subunit 3